MRKIYIYDIKSQGREVYIYERHFNPNTFYIDDT